MTRPFSRRTLTSAWHCPLRHVALQWAPEALPRRVIELRHTEGWHGEGTAKGGIADARRGGDAAPVERAGRGVDQSEGVNPRGEGGAGNLVKKPPVVQLVSTHDQEGVGGRERHLRHDNCAGCAMQGASAYENIE